MAEKHNLSEKNPSIRLNLCHVPPAASPLKAKKKEILAT
jgi:hypothetical protein